ncbi:MAG: signal peptide peptidase SppA [Halieaceae bacterium MED-G27]|nr:MAG: signal peptide peptidase SppA [Halieaceae bacterium MED-G27]
MDLLKSIWRILAAISKAISVLVPLVLFGFVILIFSASVSESVPEALPEQAGLLIAPNGPLVEDRSELEPFDALFAADFPAELLLSSLIEAIDQAADDPRITSIVLDLEGMVGPSTSQTMEIVEAIDRFKASGKPVLAHADYLSQSQYLLASSADELVVHPEGGAMLTGFGVYRTYMKQFLDNIKVNFHVFRVGENKSAVEPYMRDDMSDSQREVVGQWLGSLWRDYSQMVETSRGLEAGGLDAFINSFPERLVASNGDVAETFLKAGLVDQLLNDDDLETWLADTVGATDSSGEAELVGLRRYINDYQSAESGSDDAVIAVVAIEGSLMPGSSGQGVAGSDSIISHLERAHDDDIAALVVRINSGGGSVFASEVIRTKIEAIAADGIPVIASMGGAAASGGYWIAAQADEIWAMPTTITGSIGVWSVFPTLEGVLDYAGLTVDGVGTTDLAASFDASQALDNRSAAIFQATVDGIYDDFIALVSERRDMSPEAVEVIAGGKVWIGRDAIGIGLVDELGSLDQAVAAAATRAGVAEGYQAVRYGTEVSPQQLVLEELGRNFGLAGVRGFDSVWQWLAPIRQQLAFIDTLRDPKHVYLQCFDCNYVY